MSSFLFDYAIGLGDSDSKGLIEQPIMDREVISIGGSSSEDTRRGAFDSESSSSERVRASCCVGRGVFRPHIKARPSAPTGEPVPVTVILPPCAYEGVRRGNGGRDSRTSPHVQRNQSVGSPLSILFVASYE